MHIQPSLSYHYDLKQILYFEEKLAGLKQEKSNLFSQLKKVCHPLMITTFTLHSHLFSITFS